MSAIDTANWAITSKLRSRRGIPSIVFGPGSIAQAHGADEFVPLDHLDHAVAVYEGIALRLGGW